MAKQLLIPGLPPPTSERFEGSVDAYFTHPTDADRLVAFAEPSPGDRFLDPCAGEGALIDALLRHPNAPQHIVAIEKHEPFVATLHQRYSKNQNRVSVEQADFLTWNNTQGAITKAVMNPPYKSFLDVLFIEAALKHAHHVFALLWVNALFNSKRAAIWNQHKVVSIEFMSNRPKPFERGSGKPYKPMRDYVLIHVRRGHNESQAHQCTVRFR